MVRKLKQLERMRNSPQGWSFEPVKAVLEYFGFELTKIKGSHHTFVHSSGRQVSIVYRSTNILPIYVKQAIEAIDDVCFGGEDSDEGR